MKSLIATAVAAAVLFSTNVSATTPAPASKYEGKDCATLSAEIATQRTAEVALMDANNGWEVGKNARALSQNRAEKGQARRAARAAGCEF